MNIQDDDFDQHSLLYPAQQRPTGFFLRLYQALFGTSQDNEDRVIYLDKSKPPTAGTRVRNVVRNQKYNFFTFIPIVLYDQFKFFFNMFFLLIALSQFIESLKVGFLFTYVAPLVLVLTFTMIKEGYDDIQRYRRDKEANSTKYT